MIKKFHYRDLKRILMDLGFEEEHVKGCHYRLFCSKHDLNFILPDDDEIPYYHLVGIRRMLSERGVMEPDDFEELLSKEAHIVLK